MKLGDTGLDDLLNEAQFVLRDDGRPVALLLLRFITALYRALKHFIALVLAHEWQSSIRMPAPGDEPFDAELEREWGLQ